MNMQDSPPGDWTQRYLRLLNTEGEAPSLAALARLTRAHMLTVPFGNVTSLLRYRAHRTGDMPPLDLNDLLLQWEEGRGSGVCFEIAWAFSRLLTDLGYAAFPVPGAIGTVMGGHQAIIVAFGAARYLVEVGNGTPIFDPVPVDRVVEVRHVGLAYRFRPGDQPGEHLQERWISGEWTPFCRYELRCQGDAERDAAYRRLMTPHAAYVVGELRIVRCTEDNVYSLNRADLTRFTAGGKRTEHLESYGDYERAIGRTLGLPGLPIREALAVLEEIGDAQ